jgi:DNA replication protein DnaC
MTTAICDKHGDYEQQTIDWPGGMLRRGCPKCTADAIEKQREFESRQALADRFRRSHIPAAYRDLSLDSFPIADGAPGELQRRALAICRRWVATYDLRRVSRDLGAWLVMHGGVGTGKTGLACAIGAALIECDRRVGYWTVQGMCSWVWDARDRQSSAGRARDDLRNRELLIIDEIGAGGGSEAEAALLFEVLNHRYQNARPVVLVTNCSLPELQKGLGDRAWRRVKERAAMVACEWPAIPTRGGAIDRDVA